MTPEALCEHVSGDDVTAALSGGLGRDLGQIVGKQLEMLRTNEHAALDASAHNDKFATSPDVFEAAFGEFDEFLEGVAGQVGLPATKLAQGIENQFCYGPDAQEEHTTSNKGGTKFTAAEEYEFVTNPDLSKTYGNGRQGTQLDVFLLAAGAQRRDDGERLDMPLSEIEAKYGADMLDSVKTQVLRKGKEAFLSEEPLLRSLKALRDQHAADSEQLKGLQQKLADVVEETEDGGSGIIDFQWAGFCTKRDQLPQLEVALCEPALADVDLVNADELKGKIAVAKLGRSDLYQGSRRKTIDSPFLRKAKRVIAAGQ